MKKLSLKVETLTTLSEDRAQDVAGGILPTGGATLMYCPTNYYTCRYCPSHPCTTMQTV